jgi:hypothetical protein
VALDEDMIIGNASKNANLHNGGSSSTFNFHALTPGMLALDLTASFGVRGPSYVKKRMSSGL